GAVACRRGGGFCTGDGECAGAGRCVGPCGGGDCAEAATTMPLRGFRSLNRALRRHYFFRRFLVLISAATARVVSVVGSGTWAKALASSAANCGVAAGTGAKAPL